jgi:NAD(P)-dependent dehydrogenase (short-subunit alcohol dehydrogenase family)
MRALDGKAIVITGSSRGIGAAYAKAAAAHGASVVVNGTDVTATEQVVEEIRAAGGIAVAHVASVASWDEAEGLVQRSVVEFGRIDGLVNNAGIFALCKADALSEPMLRGMIEVNLLGSAFCGVHAIRRMLDQGYGSIVNTVSGAMVGLPFMSAYGASKAGVAALTYSWASDLAGSGVRVNAVSPMAFTRMSDIDPPEGFEGDWLAEKLPATQVTPEQNAPVVLFLLSDQSAAVHGQVVRIQGQELSLMRKPEIVQPVLHRDAWTVEGVAQAFAHELRDVLQPAAPGGHLNLTGARRR